jgi:hypothetical protein
MVLRYDRTNSNCAGFTQLVKGTATYSASLLDGEKGIGSNASPDMVCVYAAMWSGAAAEMTNTQLKALLQALGWAIAWTP